MIIGSTEEDENTLQFYQIVTLTTHRPITSTSSSMLKTSNTSGNSVSVDICSIYMVYLLIIISSEQ